MSADPARDLLRHTLATVAYRGGKAVRGAPPEFARFRVREGTRTPDAILAHVGQIAMLRRLAGAPVRGENYYKADIAAGRVGPEQAAPRVEFD